MILALIILAAGLATAQTPASGPILRLNATTDNVSGAPDPIRIDLLRWSTDAERDQVWDSLAARYGIAPRPKPVDAALASLCHVLLNSNEFLYVD